MKKCYFKVVTNGKIYKEIIFNQNMFDRLRIYADASLRIYGNNLLTGFASSDSMGNPAFTSENEDMTTHTEYRNHQICLSAKRANSFKNYKTMLDSPLETNAKEDLGSFLKGLSNTSEWAAALTPAAAFTGFLAILFNLPSR